MASFVFAILALLTCWIPLVHVLGMILGLLSVFLGLLSLVYGLFLRAVFSWGVIGIALSIGSLAIAFQVQKVTEDAVKQMRQDLERSKANSIQP